MACAVSATIRPRSAWAGRAWSLVAVSSVHLHVLTTSGTRAASLFRRSLAERSARRSQATSTRAQALRSCHRRRLSQRPRAQHAPKRTAIRVDSSSSAAAALSAEIARGCACEVLPPLPPRSTDLEGCPHRVSRTGARSRDEPLRRAARPSTSPAAQGFEDPACFSRLVPWAVPRLEAQRSPASVKSASRTFPSVVNSPRSRVVDQDLASRVASERSRSRAGRFPRSRVRLVRLSLENSAARRRAGVDVPSFELSARLDAREISRMSLITASRCAPCAGVRRFERARPDFLPRAPPRTRIASSACGSRALWARSALGGSRAQAPIVFLIDSSQADTEHRHVRHDRGRQIRRRATARAS